MNQPYYPGPGQQQQPGFGQPQFAPQGTPAPAYPPAYQPAYPQQQVPQAPQPGYGQPPGAPMYAPGYQPMPQAPRQNGPQVDVDGAGEEGSEYPKCTWANGLPWYLSVFSCTEFPSYYSKGSNIFCINADVRQSPDPNFSPGMRVSVLIKGLGDHELNNKAQARLKAFLAACCNESTQGQQPGHFAGRKAQALAGQLNGAPFAVSFTQKIAQKSKQPYLTPAFQRG